MNKNGLRCWVEQNLQEGEQIVWVGSPRLVFFRGVFLTRVLPGLMLLGLAVWFHLGAPGIPLPDWAMFLTAAFPKEVVFLLALLLLVVSPLRAYMLRHTSYVLTNRRIIKARVLSNRVRQWPLDILTRARRIDYRDGLSSYIFDEWEDGPHRHEHITRGIYYMRPDFREALEKVSDG
jgi:hypothetical protein